MFNEYIYHVVGWALRSDVTRTFFLLQILEECYDKFSPAEIFLSFNGGKDCTVLLHLATAVLRRKFPSLKEPLYVVYIQSQDPFPEVEEFIAESVKRYGYKVPDRL